MPTSSTRPTEPRSLLVYLRLSFVAAIVGDDGSLRVVIERRKSDFYRHHKQPGERVFVVPDLRVNEWEIRDRQMIPWLIRTVFAHVNKVLAPVNKCGDCTACCRTLLIRDEKFFKPAHQICTKCTTSGCRIYAARPTVCRRFECLWLKSQGGNDPMSPELRPDRCGVIFTGNSLDPDDMLTFELHPTQGHTILDGDIVARQSDRMQAQGMKAKLITHYIDQGEQP